MKLAVVLMLVACAAVAQASLENKGMMPSVVGLWDIGAFTANGHYALQDEGGFFEDGRYTAWECAGGNETAPGWYVAHVVGRTTADGVVGEIEINCEYGHLYYDAEGTLLVDGRACSDDGGAGDPESEVFYTNTRLAELRGFEVTFPCGVGESA